MTAAVEGLNTALAGHYRIDREIGAGGMATVYLAHDVKHERDVAIKVLHSDLGAALGGDRFLSEIRTTAKLQHPHILPLLDSGNADALLYYVMPLVTGETLRARLERERQLPVADAIRIAREIASALDYAHRHGVIHRDIKPENILLHDGQALVADFGIALAVQSAGGARMTQTGLSLGTPQYMSPEQAMGERTIDARSDIYSLGAVTYEMLVGEAPFTGPSIQAIVARVLTEEPRGIGVQRKAVPASVEHAVMQSLEKLPADRFENAKAFSDALMNPSSLASASSARATVGGSATRTRFRDPAFLAIGAVAIGAIALASVLAMQARRSATDDAPVVAKFALEIPDSINISAGGGARLAISRDGSQLVYVAVPGIVTTGMLQLRRLDDPVARPIPGADRAGVPSFSPDGRSVVFVRGPDADNRVAYVLPTSGGTPRQISTQRINHVNWGDGDRIVAADRTTLFELSVDGRPLRVIFRADSAQGVRSIGRPEVLPGGSWVLITYWRRGGERTIDDARLALVSMKDGAFEDLGIAGADGRYAEPGYLLFGRSGGEVYAVPFSVSRHKATGPPILLLRDVDMAATGVNLSLTVSHNGTLVFVPRDARTASGAGRPLAMVTVDRNGVERALSRDTANYESPRVSPDGRRIAVTIGGSGADGTGSTGTWIVDVASGTKARLSTDSNSYRGEWSRDGSTVFYRQQLTGAAIVWARPWDASAPPRQVARGASDAYFEFSLGPAGGLAAVRNRTAGAVGNLRTDIVLAPVDSLGASRPLFTGVASIVNARVSPDGTLLGYASNETGRMEVYVTPIPGPGPRVLVSVDGGEEPAWSWDGKTLFYRTPLPNARMMAATIVRKPELAASRRDTLFVDNYARTISHSAYDVFPDGRLLMTKDARRFGTDRAKAYVLLNWPQLLKRLGAESGR